MTLIDFGVIVALVVMVVFAVVGVPWLLMPKR
jgi:hypothetical protein